MDSRPTVVSLCCGPGGMDLGFVVAGFRVVYACDFNTQAVATYRANIGDHVELADLTELQPERIPDADAWVSGPPCQPFSQAGARAGSADPRDMWPHVLRLLDAKRPPFAVFENVRGLLTWNRGAYARHIEDRLRGMGYAVNRVLLDAADYGVPQHRWRVFFLCRQGGAAPQAPWPTHGDPRKVGALGLFDHGPRQPWVTVRQALGFGGPAGPARLDRPAPSVTAAEGKGTSPADRARVRKAAWHWTASPGTTRPGSSRSGTGPERAMASGPAPTSPALRWGQATRPGGWTARRVSPHSAHHWGSLRPAR